MRINLEDLNPAVWFDHPEDSSARICLRLATAADLDEIRRQTVRTKVEYRRGQRFEVEQVDDLKRSELQWDKIIVDWEGIEDQNGEPIQCTKDNKLLLMTKSLALLGWVSDCLDRLNQDMLARTEALEKN